MCIPYDADMIERTPILTASGYDQVVGLSNPGGSFVALLIATDAM